MAYIQAVEANPRPLWPATRGECGGMWTFAAIPPSCGPTLMRTSGLATWLARHFADVPSSEPCEKAGNGNHDAQAKGFSEPNGNIATNSTIRLSTA